MIHFNQKPGFFQSWPIHGWNYDTHGRALAPNRSRTKHLKMIVDVTYDGAEDEKVKTLAMAFQELFRGDHVIGPDGEPMKLGEFQKLEVPTLLRAGQPNANGDVFPEDVAVKAISMGCSVRQDECQICNDNVIREKIRRLRWGIVGGLILAGAEVVGILVGWKPILNWFVENVCRTW